MLLYLDTLKKPCFHFHFNLMRFLVFLKLATLPLPCTETNLYLKDFFCYWMFGMHWVSSSHRLHSIYLKYGIPSGCICMHYFYLSFKFICFAFFEDSANKAAVMFLVVCSQISAKGLSLLVSHKQRAAFYPKGFGRMLHRCGKVTSWMSEGQITMHLLFGP